MVGESKIQGHQAPLHTRGCGKQARDTPTGVSVQLDGEEALQPS